MLTTTTRTDTVPNPIEEIIMARKNQSNTAEAPAEDTNTPATEAPAETPTEQPTEQAAPDLTEFNSVVESVLATRDEATGELTEENKGRVTTAYRALDQAAKRAAKDKAEADMMDAVQKLDGPLARALSEVRASLIAGGSSKSEKAPADPAAAYVQRMASLRLAVQIAEAEAPTVEGRDLGVEIDKLVSESQDDVTKLREYNANEAEDKGDAPEVSALVRSAFKLSAGKAAKVRTGGGSSGPTGDVAKHVIEAFAEHPSGHELKVSQIANFKSSEYPNGNASQGAISARLFPPSGKCTIEGVIPVDRDENGPRRARKA